MPDIDIDAVPDPVEYLRKTKMTQNPERWLWSKLMDRFGKGAGRINLFPIDRKQGKETLMLHMEFYRKLHQPEVEAIAQFMKDHCRADVWFAYGERGEYPYVIVIAGPGFNEPKLQNLFFHGGPPLIDGILSDALAHPTPGSLGAPSESRAALIVSVLLEDRIDEILGAVNIWLSKKGKPTTVPNHLEWAARLLGIKIGHLSGGDRDFWAIQGQVYSKMFQRGWVRVAVLHNQSELYVDYRQATGEQWEWLMDKAIEDKLKVVNPSGQILFNPADNPDIQGGPIEPEA